MLHLQAVYAKYPHETNAVIASGGMTILPNSKIDLNCCNLIDSGAIEIAGIAYHDAANENPGVRVLASGRTY